MNERVSDGLAVRVILHVWLIEMITKFARRLDCSQPNETCRNREDDFLADWAAAIAVVCAFPINLFSFSIRRSGRSQKDESHRLMRNPRGEKGSRHDDTSAAALSPSLHRVIYYRLIGFSDR
jgi:hypothetical protein